MSHRLGTIAPNELESVRSVYFCIIGELSYFIVAYIGRDIEGVKKVISQFDYAIPHAEQSKETIEIGNFTVGTAIA